MNLETLFQKTFRNSLINKGSIQQVRESFQKTLNASMREMTVERVTRSQIWKQIDKDLLEVCNAKINSKDVNTEEDATETTQILNILYVYNKSYSSHYIHWASMIQQVFLRNDELDKDEDLVTAAMYLELTLRHFAPKQNVVAEVSSKVWRYISENNRQLYSHVTECLKKNLKFQKQDFSPEIFNINKDDFETLKSAVEDGDTNDLTAEQKRLLEDPETFIRKWVIEGFVSTLKPVAAFFVWDQLYLHNWKPSLLKHTCLVLLGLLQPWFLSANDYVTMREVFIEEPYKIYTIDLRSAWKHLLKGGNFEDLSEMNRNANITGKPKPTSVLASVPTPAPVPVPEENIYDAWLLHKKQPVNNSIKIPHATDPFDFYIDSIRFTSDNCSIVKITGTFLNLYLTKKPPKVPEIIAYPEVDSPARCPEFKYKLELNRERQVMNPDALILLRAYTVERYTSEVVVIGSCLVSIFNNIPGKPVELDVGGRQIRLRRGLPNPDLDVDSLEAYHMDNNPVIPCATVLIRFLPHNEAESPAPTYQSRYYRSQLSTPNESERRVYKHYVQDKEYRMIMKDMVLMLEKTGSVSDKSASDFIKKRLSQKKSGEAIDLPFERFIKYDRSHGVMIVADKAFGLPVYLEGRFFQCLLQLFPGHKAETSGAKIQNFLTQKQDLQCVQRAPDWLDPPLIIKPLYDDHTVLIVSLYGIRPTYIPSDGDKEPILIHRGGNELRFSLDHSVAWGVVQCFANSGCLSGIHHIPLFKGQVPKSIIDKLQHSSVEHILKENMKTLRLLESASMEVTLWDGRFTTKDCPPLPIIKSYLKLIPNSQRYTKAKAQRGGPPVQQLLLESLPSSIQRNKDEFEQHKAKFEMLIKNYFNSLMNKALTDAGYSQLEQLT